MNWFLIREWRYWLGMALICVLTGFLLLRLFSERTARLEAERQLAFKGCNFVDVEFLFTDCHCEPVLVYVNKNGRNLESQGGEHARFYLHIGEYEIERIYELGGSREKSNVRISSDTTITFEDCK